MTYYWESNQLDLPICPRCNDTKHVEPNRTIRLLAGNYNSHRCTECYITWDTKFKPEPYYEKELCK